MDCPPETFKLDAAFEGSSMQRMGMRSADKNGAPTQDKLGLVGVGGVPYARHDGWGGPDTKDEWLTPPNILRALGAFDLDPCAPEKRPWEMAATAHKNLSNQSNQTSAVRCTGW